MTDKLETKDSLLERQATLVIGLGGAGGQVVARVKNCIQTTLGADSVKAKNVHFLVMDNDDFPNLDPWVRQTLDENKEFLCLSRFNPREAYMAYESDPQNMADLRVWFPSEDIRLLPNKLEDTGAARCRPLGRFFLYHNRNKARQRLNDIVSRALTGVPEARKLRVIFTHSCLGGSGSSALLDVVYMLKIILQDRGKVEGDFYDFVLLPEFFIETACKGQPALEPYLKANAFAFFRELDYIQKNPDKLNEWAMDSVSAGRTQPGRGLEPRQKPPFTMVYLIDSVIPEGSIGQFGSMNNLFDYTNNCIYYTMFCEPVFSGFNSRVCNAEGINEVDSMWGRSLRYSSVGVSEIRRPRELLREWYALKSSWDLVNLCLKGVGEPASFNDIQNSFQNLCDGIQVFEQLQEKLKGVIDSIAKKLPAADVYLISDKKVNWEEASLLNLQNVISTAQNQVENARVDLARAYAEYLPYGKETFRNSLLAFLNTWGDFRGLEFCKKVLDLYNLHLEDTIPKHQQSSQQKKREAEKKLQILEDLSRKIKKPLLGEGDNVARIHEFVEALQDYVRSALGAETSYWLAEFTRVCAGDSEGKDPLLQNVDPFTGQVVQSKTPTHSILDTLVDELRNVIDEWSKLSRREIHLEFQRELNRRGHSPSSMYLPDIFNTKLLDSPEVLDFYQKEYPVFASMEVGNRELFKELMTKIAKDFPEFGNFDSFSQKSAEEYQKLLARVGRTLAACIQLEGKSDLLSAMGSHVKSYLEKLNSFSTPVLRCTRDKIVNTEDKKRIQELAFLGAESKEIIDKAVEYGVKIDEKCDFILKEGIVHIRTMSIFPYMISDSLRGLEAAYVYRDENVRPHFSGALNNGELDNEDPLTVGKRSPLETYLKMWALTAAMKNDSEIREVLRRRLEMKMSFAQETKEPTFFFFEQNRNSPHYGLNAIYWKREGYKLSQDPETPFVHIFEQLFTNWEVSRRQAYLRYSKEYGILQCHEDILYIIENDSVENADSLLIAMYEALKKYAQQTKDACRKLMEDEKYKLVRQKESEQRMLSSQEKILVENGAFLSRIIRVLESLISYYETHYGVTRTVSFI